MGVDIAARQDYTAIAAAVPLEEDLEAYDIPFLARLPHGLTYRQIAQQVATAVRRIPTRQEIRLIADATGGYAAVVEMIMEELAADSVRIIAATIGFGEQITWERERVRVGKAGMVRRLQVMLQQERLHLPPGQIALVTRDELRHYEIRPTDAGNLQYGAFKIGKHDDVATAIGLATLGDACEVEIPIEATRTWLPGWDRGILSSAEETAWKGRQRAPRRKYDGGQLPGWFTNVRH